ncbi:MAG: ComF family protein [Spirochaetaceae bacterium]|jgi:ComF family protein|nr:ComF family protein [Spirochaetaceae bacterium]
MNTLKDNIFVKPAEKAAFISDIMEIFSPCGCALCGETLTGANEAYDGLCSECKDLFNIDLSDRCGDCGKPLISERLRCRQCKKEGGNAFNRTVVLYPYVGVFQQVIIAFKFKMHTQLAPFFAEKLVEAAPLLDVPEGAQWVPVPPRYDKLKEKGWDQVELIARHMETMRTEREFEVARILSRLASRSQKKLSGDERYKNLSGKIVVNRPPAKNVVIFDDVFTTGATISTCAEALKAAGAENIWGVCLFYD